MPAGCVYQSTKKRDSSAPQAKRVPPSNQSCPATVRGNLLHRRSESTPIDLATTCCARSTIFPWVLPCTDLPCEVTPHFFGRFLFLNGELCFRSKAFSLVVGQGGRIVQNARRVWRDYFPGGHQHNVAPLNRVCRSPSARFRVANMPDSRLNRVASGGQAFHKGGYECKMSIKFPQSAFGCAPRQ